MQLIIWIFIFLVSLVVLLKASDYFVGSAEKIGASLGLSSFVIGIVIVGIGTSLPELVSSVISVVKGYSEIVVGSVLGSNITNIFLVLGIAAVINKEIKLKYDLMKIDIPILLGTCFLIAIMIVDASFRLPEAIICIVALLMYLFNSLTDSGNKQEKEKRVKAGLKQWIILIVCSIFIYLGAEYVITAVIKISKILSIGTQVIALSAVALGTSLPELIVTISATKKKNLELAVGNIIGSNIFNTCGVMGIAALFGPLTIPKDILFFPLPMFIIATILYIIITVDKKINRWEGGLLLIFYLVYIGKLFDWV